MKNLYVSLFFLLGGIPSLSGQIDMNLFTETEANYQANSVVMPPSPLSVQVLFIGGVDYTQTSPGDSALAKQYHDFIGFTPDRSGASLGWISVNHEMIQANDKIGDGGGMTVFRVARDPHTDTLVILSQTLEDGRRGKFFNVDFRHTVGETGMNCGGITSFIDGRIWTAEEWFLTDHNEIFAAGTGVRDTADFTIGVTTPNGFPAFNGETIRKYQNFNYMVEVDPRQAVAVRKQYNWGRQGFEGGTILMDNRTVFLGVDETPAFWLKFVADRPGDFTSGNLFVYKEDAPRGSRWIQLDNRSMEGVLSIDEQAFAAGATMFTRIEWVTQDTTTGIVYMTETGSDKPGNQLANGAKAGGTFAAHHQRRAARQGTTPGSEQYSDYYGRVLFYNPQTEELGIHLSGGPEFTTDSVSAAEYPSRHLANPDGLSVITIGKQVYLIIQEDLNGRSFGRVPGEVPHKICEMFLLDLSIKNPDVNDLIRLTAVPIGAEVTGGTSTHDGKTILVNSQHPDADPAVNPFPFNNSLTVAITGWDKVRMPSVKKGLKRDRHEFKVFPNPFARALHFNSPTDAAIYNLEGAMVRVARNTDSMNVDGLTAGEYVIKNLETGAARRLVIE